MKDTWFWLFWLAVTAAGIFLLTHPGEVVAAIAAVNDYLKGQ